METRKQHSTKYSELPKDYVAMVEQVFATNFDNGLKALLKLRNAAPRFVATGRIYSDEVILSISVTFEKQMSATTVHSSIDYDAAASSPTIQDVLGACVDGVGTVFGQLFAKPEQVASESLATMEDAPFHWTELKIDKFRVYMKVDKSNPALDAIADSWLEKHDPETKAARKEEEIATKDLFVTGPKTRKH